MDAEEDAINVCKDLRYPIIVKYPQSYSSLGMTRASRCDTPEQLLAQFKRISAEFGSVRVSKSLSLGVSLMSLSWTTPTILIIHLSILEINPNGGILYPPEEYGPADYMILYDKDGYYGFFDRIFRAAIVRQKMRAGE